MLFLMSDSAHSQNHASLGFYQNRHWNQYKKKKKKKKSPIKKNVEILELAQSIDICIKCNTEAVFQLFITCCFCDFFFFPLQSTVMEKMQWTVAKKTIYRTGLLLKKFL